MRLNRLQSSTFAILAAILSLAGTAAVGNAENEASSYAAAIRAVIEQDSRLGKLRNHFSEDAPVARAVEEYVAGLDALDLEHCPPDFVRALHRHRDAWHGSIAFFEEFPNLRGEIHDVFEMIRARDHSSRARLEAVEAEILSTWVAVQNSMSQYSVW